MNQSRRQFAATLLAGGVSLFLPKAIAPVRWKVRKPSTNVPVGGICVKWDECRNLIRAQIWDGYQWRNHSMYKLIEGASSLTKSEGKSNLYNLTLECQTVKI